ncbi:MAG: hypothetical protein JO336_12545 [Acidobacteriia bacterium]|nr:hypothetical protein [Terriglobia bacterium]MBV8906678.1 hypothetical protein [Terriglobia bacterium]MBV9746769.1 hypothetical protein [Terriglobia bacterium]
MFASPHLLPADYFGPAIGALVFVSMMSFVPEPQRRAFNAIFVAGACGAYLSGGFGAWELVFPIVALPVVYCGLGSYRWIGAAWLMHALWDLAHHLWGNPIWPFLRTSSFGCMTFDSLIAIWFLAGAPALLARQVAAGRRPADGPPL